MQYYTYTVWFVDGHYYHGMAKYRGVDPLLDGYYGTPVTYKHKWQETMFWKEITGTFNTQQEANLFEQEQINKCYKTDPKCLNANCGGYILDEHIRKGHEKLRQRGEFFYDPEWQKQNQEKCREEKIGIYAPGVRSRGSANQPREVKQKTGKRVGLLAKTNKLGIFGLSLEEQKRNKSMGAKTQHAQRWMNTDDNHEPFVSTPCGLSRWQKHRGIDTAKRIRVL